MKKITILTMLAGMMVVPSLLAVPYGDVSTVGGYGPYQTGQGGEFTLRLISDEGLGANWVNNTISYYDGVAKNQVSGAGNQPNIQTFCVEGTEYINQNRTYDPTIGDSTMYGSKTLTIGAAWLYAQFASGQLVGYNYGVGRSGFAGSSADLLQRTLWALMTEESQTEANTISDPFTILVKNQFGNWANATVANANTYPVAVLRLWENGDTGHELAGNRAQDQLILTGPVGHNAVPDGAATIGLLGFALTSLGFVNRKFRK